MASVSETGKFRSLTGPARLLQRVALILIPLVSAVVVLDVAFFFRIAFFRQQYYGLLIVLILTAVFLSVRPSKKDKSNTVPWYDWILVLASWVIGFYIIVMFPKIVDKLAYITWDKVILGAIALALFFEASRRLVGWVLVGLGILLILYTRYGYLVPAPFTSAGASWERLFTYLYLDSNAILGLPLAIVGSVVIGFLLFGQLLMQSGGGRFLSDLAMALTGRFRGGPAKVAVIASSLFGTLTGSAVSNVVVTGTVTIPLMKKVGYKPHIAGAIEAAASAGGQIMPPVMAVAAFLIAEFLEIPYSEVALAAIIPAILYYVAIFAQVDLEAAKMKILGLSKGEIPRLAPIIREGWVYIIPVLTLVYALFIAHLPAGRSAFAAVGATLLVVTIGKARSKMWRGMFTILENTGKIVLDLGVIVGVAGIIIGAISLSGLSFKLSMLLVAIAGSNLIVLLFIVAITSIILGMGMPTTAVYILLAVLVAPALIRLGVEPLAAHLFVLYFGVMSHITPPICFAAYAGASIAGANFMQTGFAALRLGIAGFLVPFMFVYAPALILKGNFSEIVVSFIAALGGITALAIILSGYLFGKINWATRLLLSMGVAAIVGGVISQGSLATRLYLPSWTITLVGIGIVSVVIIINWLKEKRIQRMRT